MYKSAAKDINDYINEYFKGAEYFTYEETLLLVDNKIKSAKEKEADELFNMVQTGYFILFYIVRKNPNLLSKNDLVRSLSSIGIEASEREVTELMEFANAHSSNKIDNTMTRDDFKKFYVS